jgi:hypothetical protein
MFDFIKRLWYNYYRKSEKKGMMKMSLQNIKSLITNVIPIHIYINDEFITTILSVEDSIYDTYTVENINIKNLSTIDITIKN